MQQCFMIIIGVTHSETKSLSCQSSFQLKINFETVEKGKGLHLFLI